MSALRRSPAHLRAAMVPEAAAAELGRLVLSNVVSIIVLALAIAVCAAWLADDVSRRQGIRCDHGIAVMTPSGAATSVCAP